MMSPAVHEAAKEYAKRGWSVIPLGADKTPVIRSWTIHQTHLTPPKDVEGWVPRLRAAYAVGIVLGPVSGNLAARDFDELDSYQRWSEAHPDLAATLPTARTARGFHVYFRWSDVKTTVFDDGELRGKGAYMVAPPSPHPSGVVYQWLRPLTADPVPEVDPTAAGLDRDWTRDVRHREHRDNRDDGDNRANRDTEDTEETEDTEVTEAIAKGLLAERAREIGRAVVNTLPSGFSSRNAAVFALARELLGIPGLRRLPVRYLRETVAKWHRLANPKILTKDFGTTWGDFVNAWGKVRFPAGEDILGRALARAREAPDPEWLLAMDYAPEHRLLVKLCRELQREAGTGAFFLSTRKAGESIGVDFGVAGRWFKALIGDEVLVEVVKGSQHSRRATRWRYIGPDLQYPKDLVHSEHGNSDGASSAGG